VCLQAQLIGDGAHPPEYIFPWGRTAAGNPHSTTDDEGAGYVEVRRL
jgi:hypothetical protein